MTPRRTSPPARRLRRKPRNRRYLSRQTTLEPAGDGSRPAGLYARPHRRARSRSHDREGHDRHRVSAPRDASVALQQLQEPAVQLVPLEVFVRYVRGARCPGHRTSRGSSTAPNPSRPLPVAQAILGPAECDIVRGSVERAPFAHHDASSLRLQRLPRLDARLPQPRPVLHRQADERTAGGIRRQSGRARASCPIPALARVQPPSRRQPRA